MTPVEEIWRSKTDEELSEAGAHLEEFTEDGERIIRAELAFRGHPAPPPIARRAKAQPAGTRAKKTSPETVLSHWSTLIENLQASPLHFYQSVEAGLRRRQVPELENSRVEYREAGIFSANREYLHILRRTLVFDVCAAPFGTGFFVSSWLAETKPSLHPLVRVIVFILLVGAAGWVLSTYGLVGTIALCIIVPALLWIVHSAATDSNANDDLVRALPVLGPIYEWLFRPETYYRHDTTLMFQNAVHNAVLDAVDELTTAKGLRALSESERKPVMREFFQRKGA